MNAYEEVCLELSSIAFSKEEAKALLSATIKASGSLHIENKGVGITIDTANAAAARVAAKALETLYGIEAEINCNRPNTVQKKRTYTIEILPKNAQKILTDCNIFDYRNDIVSEWNDGIGKSVKTQAGAYMRGLFMCIGNLTIPSTTNKSVSYYLSLEFENNKLAEDVLELLKSFDIPMRSTTHNETLSLYNKSGEKISDFLALMGASKSVLNLNCVMTDRMVRNTVNRITNCNIANLDKAVGAGAKQCEQIRIIDKKIGISSLSDKLQTVAKARLEHPDMTYDELAEVIGGDISKSGINHRFRKIAEIAEELKD